MAPTALRKQSRKPAAAADKAPSGAAREILDAGAWLLRHRGYEATTTRAIAERVGIKAGSIYHHFRSKDAIVQHVLDDGVRIVGDAVLGELGALPKQAPPLQRLAVAVRTHLLASLEGGDYVSASIRAFAFLPKDLRRNCRVERRRYEDIWRKLIAEAARAGHVPKGVSPDAARLMLLGALNWAGEWYRPGGLSIDEISASYMKLAFGQAAAAARRRTPATKPRA
ncbi:MAG: TetR family transcriptional regulator [Hyphomicrobiales bacterium]|nr:TetR family transcriptional regulator [Hyphomicrobiales bacterium]